MKRQGDTEMLQFCSGPARCPHVHCCLRTALWWRQQFTCMWRLTLSPNGNWKWRKGEKKIISQEAFRIVLPDLQGTDSFLQRSLFNPLSQQCTYEYKEVRGWAATSRWCTRDQFLSDRCKSHVGAGG